MPPKAAKKKLHELAVLLPEGTKINDPSKKKDYILGKQFATGGFGRIYTCKEENTSNDLVVKVEPSGNGPLFTEVNVFQRILRKEMIETFKKDKQMSWIGLPYLISGGILNYKSEKLRFMIIPQYATSLEALREKKKLLNSKETWEVTHCILQSLEYVHEKQYTHADIKAANILLENKNDYSTAVLVDYGLARFSANNIDKPDKKRAHNGTAIFTSCDAHMGNHPSFRGDIEILAYNIIYWLTGSLPWLEFEANPAKVFEKKQSFLKDVSKNVKSILADYPSSIDAVIAFFDMARKTSYVAQVDFQKLFSVTKKALASASSRKRVSEVKSITPENKKKKSEEKSTKKHNISTTGPATPSIRRKRVIPLAGSPSSKPATLVRKKGTTPAVKRSNRLPVVSPVLDAIKNCVSPIKKSPKNNTLEIKKDISIEKPASEVLQTSSITTRRKYKTQPISPSVKMCPETLMKKVPGMRNFERGRRSIIAKQISKKYQRMARNRRSTVDIDSEENE